MLWSSCGSLRIKSWPLWPHILRSLHPQMVLFPVTSRLRGLAWICRLSYLSQSPDDHARRCCSRIGYLPICSEPGCCRNHRVPRWEAHRATVVLASENQKRRNRRHVGIAIEKGSRLWMCSEGGTIGWQGTRQDVGRAGCDTLERGWAYESGVAKKG